MIHTTGNNWYFKSGFLYCCLTSLLIILFSLEAHAAWVQGTVDLPQRDISTCSSRAIAVNPVTGQPHVLFGGSEGLLHAYYDGATWHTETVDSSTVVRKYTGECFSIAVDASGKVHVSYYDSTNSDLRYATNASGSWVASTLDSTGFVGDENAIATDHSMKVHISYYDATNRDLKYATNASGSWVISTLDSAGYVGRKSSIASDAGSKVHISYVDETGLNLRYVTNASGSWIVSNLATARAGHTSLALDPAGKVHIAYYDSLGSQRYVKYITNASGSWTGADIETDSYTSSTEISLVADSGSSAHVVYRLSGTIKYATNVSGSWAVSPQWSGSGGSVASGNAGILHVSYNGNGGIRHASRSSGPWADSLIERAMTYSWTRRPCMAIDTSDTTHLVYISDQSELTYATNALGAWASGVVDAAGYAKDGTCYLAVDSSGSVHVTYTKKGTSEVMYLSNAGEAWAVTTFESGTAGPVATGTGNTVHFTYVGSGGVTYATNSTGSWTSSVISSTGQSARALRIAPDGSARAVYTKTAAPNPGVFFATNESGSWGSSFLTSNPSPNYQSFAIDSVFKVHAVRGDLYDELLHASNASGIWTEETASRPYRGYAYGDDLNISPELAVDNQNRAHIVFSYAANDAGTGPTYFDIGYVTNKHGYWVEFYDPPGTAGYCTAMNHPGTCNWGYPYPLAMALDTDGFPRYVINATLYAKYRPDMTVLAAGYEHTLFINDDGTLWAWGHNGKGQLGDGTAVDRISPVRVGTASDWVAVSGGWQHSLALKKDGTLWAWGGNDFGQLGDGTTTSRLSPARVGSSSDWVRISAGGAHSLALKANGELWAWGINSVGQLGDGTTATRLSPVRVGSASDWKAIAAGWEHSVAVMANNSLWAWGWNSDGQVGDGTRVNKASPFQIGTGYSYVIAAGWKHTLAIKTNATLWAWGDNEFGQLGDGTTADRLSPVQIGTGWALAAAGGAHSFGVKTDGSLWAWGGNFQGQLGDGTTTIRLAPVPVGSHTDWQTIAAGWEHSAGIRIGPPGVSSWGWNEFGQVGDGTTANRYVPVLIAIPVDADGDGYYSDVDCDDSNPLINVMPYWHPDVDSDGFGNPAVSLQQCSQPAGYVLDGTDCDDSDPFIFPGGLPVRIANVSEYYGSLQEAYTMSENNDIIQVKNMALVHNVIMNESKPLTISGGYDCAFSLMTGMTTIKGTITISDGTVRIEGIILK